MALGSRSHILRGPDTSKPCASLVPSRAGWGAPSRGPGWTRPDGIWTGRHSFEGSDETVAPGVSGSSPLGRPNVPAGRPRSTSANRAYWGLTEPDQPFSSRSRGLAARTVEGTSQGTPSVLLPVGTVCEGAPPSGEEGCLGQRVTVCIGALCEGRRAVVLAADRRITLGRGH